MTSLTILSLLVIITAAATRKYYWVALGVGGGTPIGATLILGNDALPTFYAAAIGAAIGLVGRFVGHLRAPVGSSSRLFPGAIPLLLFTAWGVVITLLAPILFSGTSVFLGPNRDSVSTIRGALTTSNIAQLGYLLLGVAVIFYLAGARSLRPGVVGLAAGLVILLSFWKYLYQSTGLPFPDGVFDNNTTYAFIETLPGGAPRFRGILSEPAGLATSSIVMIAFAISRAAQSRGWRRLGVLAVGTMAAFMAFISTSTTFVIVAVIIGAMASVLVLRRLLKRPGRSRYLGAVLLCVLLAIGIYLLPLAVQALTQLVHEKLGTTSYADRTLSDNRAYQLFIEKFPLGVGLGSNRSGSFLAFLLGTTGIIGVGLFVWTVWAIVRPVRHNPSVRPVVWALIAMLTTKLISSPDLADSTGVLYLSLGVLAWQGGRERLAELQGRAGGRGLRSGQSSIRTGAGNESRH